MPRQTKSAFARQLAVEAWQASKDKLDAAKVEEMRLRLAVIGAEFGPDALNVAGTVYAELAAAGEKLKLEIRRSAKVDADKLGGALQRLRLVAGAVKAKLLGERLISWKPVASIAELKKLEPEHAKVFDGVITIELGSPSLELIKPPAT